MKSKKAPGITGGIFIYAAVILFGVLTLFPFAWMLSSSLKHDFDVFASPMQWIPHPALWRNYVEIWSKIPLATYIRNTSFLTIVITFTQLLSSSLAAYPFAKMNFRGRNAIFMAYVATMAVPWQAIMVPQYILISRIHLSNTFWALILIQSFTPFGVFLMRQFYMSIPDELSEAARIDGMGDFGIYRTIVLPLAKPAIATLIIFTFVFVWNDYLGPLLYLTSDSLKTIQIGMRAFVTQNATLYNYIMAASLITIIPIFIVYLFMQKYFIEGIATTGIK